MWYWNNVYKKRVLNRACKFMSKVVYRDLVAYQQDWVEIHHLFTDSLHIIFPMSYWWAYNSGVVEQNKVRKSWWKVINNFVSIVTAWQLNVLLMQHWHQCILSHHLGISKDIFHPLWRNLFQTIVSELLDDWQFYFKTLLLTSHRIIKFPSFEFFFSVTPLSFPEYIWTLQCMCLCFVGVCEWRSGKPIQGYQILFCTARTIFATTTISCHYYSLKKKDIWTLKCKKNIISESCTLR